MDYNPKNYPLTFHAEKTQWLQPKKFIPSLFMAKTNAVERLKNKEFTGCSNFCEGDYSQKESRQRIVISSACCSQHSRNRNRIVRSRFRLLCFCYGSNSGVGSYTSIISRAANRNPIVNACSSCLSEISASAFSNCSSRAFCCSVRVALSFVSSRTMVTNDPPLSVPFVILCTVFSKNERLNAILIQSAESLHRFFIFHGILFVNKQKQEKYICLKLHIEKSGCHPLS